jgi:hypothetical protein
MALADLQAFIVQCLGNVDPTLDLTPGSPYDVQVVQPILTRIGTDPFTVDIGLFIQTLLNQNFPDMATKEGDAITDLLIKGAIVLWNPIVREITRISNAQSFEDPSILTLDEATALGANLFAAPNPGGQATGIARIYFAQPQDVNITPANFVTDQNGNHFFPTEIQGIRVEEMLLNLDGSLYYFDINLIAEAPGSQYNIGPDELVTIANVASAQRITNLASFSSGIDADTAVSFIDELSQSLTERSLVTLPGISTNITAAFADVTSLNVRGFNDPEMLRDIITGGGLGPILASGTLMETEGDGDNQILTRRVTTTDPGVDFTALIGPTNQSITGFTLTLTGPTGTSAFAPFSQPLVRDLAVQTVVDTQTLDLADQVMAYSVSDCSWTLRANVLTLSGIPGGILYPNQPDGTVTVPNNQIHIGGCTDIYVRGESFDSSTLVLSSIVDDDPLLSGIALVFDTVMEDPNQQTVTLADLVMGAPGPGGYSQGDSTWTALADAADYGFILQILDPPNAGPYRVLSVTQTNGFPPALVITPPYTYAPVVPPSVGFRWHLTSSIFIDLEEPKDTKISGSDLTTVLGQSIVSTSGGTDFSNYGVGAGDVLRILTGNLIVGDYVVQAVLTPLYTQLQLDRPLPATVNDAQYYVFTSNPAGGVTLPFIRVDSIDLLDTSGQPVGTTIPYANPVLVQSQGFANAAHGVKADIEDGILGIVSQPFAGGTVTIVSGSADLYITWDGLVSSPLTVPLTPGVQTLADIAGAINAEAGLRLAVLLPSAAQAQRIGILPIFTNVKVLAAPLNNAMLTLFGFNDRNITSRDVRSGDAFLVPAESEIDTTGGWDALRPRLDPVNDVVQVLDGVQVGFYDGIVVPNSPYNSAKYDPLLTDFDFSPEFDRHIQVGARSLGTARLYFLDPTSFEVDPDSVFEYVAADGTTLLFFPDPTNNYQSIPPLPSGAPPTDGTVGSSLPNYAFFQSLSTDFVRAGTEVGDLLVVSYIPFSGSVSIAPYVAGLASLVLTISINGSVDKNIIFVRDSSAIPPGAVTAAGVVNQINQVVGQTICSLNGSNQLQFSADVAIIVRGSNAVYSANGLLGFSAVPGIDQNNNSPNAGTYTINTVAPNGNANRVKVTPSFTPTSVDNQAIQTFSVLRAGVQRVNSTVMSTQTSSANLYYFDVDLLSVGTGDVYNLPFGTQMAVEGFRSDGYYLTTADPNLTFSPVEQPQLHISPTILEVGTSDSPANATQLLGQNIQLNYDSSSIAANVDNYIRSDTERVINESPLGRHLIPYYVRFSMSYSGGSASNLVISDLETYINGLAPTDLLEVSSLEQIALNRNATSVENPITLYAVIHNFDRSITVETSQDSLNVGSLAAFIPDVLLVTQTLT